VYKRVVSPETLKVDAGRQSIDNFVRIC